MKATTLRRLIVIALIALWEVLPRSGLVPELFLPSLSSTLTAGWTEAGEYRNALATTLYEVAISMAFACGGGILLGALVGSLPRPRVLIMPMISSLYAVPLVILYPVFTVWLGVGSESKIAFASIYGFLPTMLATAAGIQTIDPQLLLAARSMGATLSQRLIRDRGREGFRPPLPPNRTGGFPAYGSPVAGFLIVNVSRVQALLPG